MIKAISIVDDNVFEFINRDVGSSILYNQFTQWVSFYELDELNYNSNMDHLRFRIQLDKINSFYSL